MDSDNFLKINELIVQYTSTKDKKILDDIEYRLKILEFQSWNLKFKLRLIEHPNKFSKDDTIKSFEYLFSFENAYSKYHLILPLFLYLFTHHAYSQSALDTALSFMAKSKSFLRAGDFAKTQTGVQRFITNTRFAALELRNLGFLRSDSRHFYKYWQLSLFGIIVACSLYLKIKKNSLNDFNKNYSWYKAKDSAYNILSSNISESKNPDNFKSMIDFLFEEDIVTKYHELYSDKFLNFTDYIVQVLEKGFNARNQFTKDLVSYLNSINADGEISKLADAIKLRKDIEVNLETVYKIINSDRPDSEYS